MLGASIGTGESAGAPLFVAGPGIGVDISVGALCEAAVDVAEGVRVGVCVPAAACVAVDTTVLSAGACCAAESLAPPPRAAITTTAMPTARTPAATTNHRHRSSMICTSPCCDLRAPLARRSNPCGRYASHRRVVLSSSCVRPAARLIRYASTGARPRTFVRLAVTVAVRRLGHAARVGLRGCHDGEHRYSVTCGAGGIRRRTPVPARRRTIAARHSRVERSASSRTGTNRPASVPTHSARPRRRTPRDRLRRCPAPSILWVRVRTAPSGPRAPP
jgi:hypothetical protein